MLHRYLKFRFIAAAMLPAALVVWSNMRGGQAEAQPPVKVSPATGLQANGSQAETSPSPAVRQAPQVLKAGDHGVGRQTGDANFADLTGRKHQLSALCKERIVVVAATGTSCPLSKKYLPSLVDLAQEFAGKNVRWLLVNATKTDDVAAMQADFARFAEFAKDDAVIYVHDAAGSLAAAVGLRTTTDVAVLDGARTVLYRGAVDDQYGFGYAKDAPQQRYLAAALTGVLAGGRPAVAATDAPGCALATAAVATNVGAATVTYHNRISRIMQNNCLECHRSGGSAPFSLAMYEEVDDHAPMIRQVVERGVMPPWFAAKSSAVKHAGWSNDRSLSAADKADLLAWIDGKRPRGDAADAPRPIAFTDEWTIGKPDAVFGFAKPEKIKATGTMPYQVVGVDTDLAEDKWVQAVEVRPGNRAVVHHVLVFALGPGDSLAGGERQEGREGYWAIYVPGNSAVVYPEGFAKRLPKGARLRFQMHYTPIGTETEDRTEIGFIYAKEPPKHEVRVAGIVNARLNIPPHAADHREEARLRLPFDAVIMAFLPHMHLRGKACRYEATTAGGEQLLLDIPRYDFNWQLSYRLTEPLSLRRGDVLNFTAWFDNSAANPANPDPTKTVRWGPQTYDEMHLGYVEYYVPGAKPGKASPESPSDEGRPFSRLAQLAATAAGGIFDRFDTNGDDAVSQEELQAGLEKLPRLKDLAKRPGAVFKKGDRNADGKIDREEFEQLRQAVAADR